MRPVGVCGDAQTDGETDAPTPHRGLAIRWRALRFQRNVEPVVEAQHGLQQPQ